MKTLHEIQEEVKQWAYHNFGGQPSWTSILGMMEELGEMELAVTPLDKYDAVGDFQIYLMNFCVMEGIDLEMEIGACEEEGLIMPKKRMVTALAKLSHHYLKRAQKIRKNEDHEGGILDAVLGIYFGVKRYCDDDLNTDAIKVLNDVWEQVKQRDWTKENGNNL